MFAHYQSVALIVIPLCLYCVSVVYSPYFLLAILGGFRGGVMLLGHIKISSAVQRRARAVRILPQRDCRKIGMGTRGAGA